MYEWPIEVHLLCYMMTSKLTQTALEKVCRDVYKQSPVLDKVDECIHYYSNVPSMSKMDAVYHLLSGWETWDLYALTILLFEKKTYPSLRPIFHHDPSKRLTIRSARLAARLAISSRSSANRRRISGNAD